jgi:hypothetical protein
MKISEKQIEDVFAVYHDQLIENNLKLIGRQYALENQLRVDLLFKDKNNKNLVVELKKDSISREDIGQTLQYAGLIKDSRVILAAPIIASSIKTAFEHYGIEYIEFYMSEIERLFNKLKDSPQEKSRPSKIDLPRILQSVPISNKSLVDGNIAFKLTYNDKNWNGVCSVKLYDYNYKNRTWCGKQDEYGYNCQDEEFSNPKDLNENHSPCFESFALKTLSFSPGVSHGDIRRDTPYRCLNAKVGKIALFTSRTPDEIENERFILAIGVIDYIQTSEDREFEVYYIDKDTAIIFDKDNYPKFWKYYRNQNTDRVAWNTGLFRYVEDKTIRQLLLDLQGSKDKIIKNKATYLLKLIK